MKRILILGGYGNFGSVIAKILITEDVTIIIAGRSQEKAAAKAKSLGGRTEFYRLDINQELLASLKIIKPNIVVHTSGPYQGKDYNVANCCIDYGCHYVDLSDARDFVAGISCLDNLAKKKSLLICSGASSVPCLTSAMIDHYIGNFAELETVEYAISTAQLTNRGLSTVKAVLSYAGKPFKTLIDGKMSSVYGWLGIRAKNMWGLNLRLLSNCDIPDLEIFPKRYPSLKNITFKAGLELKVIHFGLYLLALLVRLKLLRSLQPLANILLRISYLFDPIGNNDSGFYMELTGKDHKGQTQVTRFDLVAFDGDGLYIPCIPAIILIKKLVNNEISHTGATACIGLISLSEYLDELEKFNIKWQENILK